MSPSTPVASVTPETPEHQEKALLERARLATTDAEKKEVYFELLRLHPDNATYKRNLRAAVASAKATDEAVARATRLAYATTLREHFLDESMDIKVSVTGKASEHLVLKFSLFNDVWVHKFRQGDLAQEIAKLGFKDVKFTDGYDYNVLLTFHS